MLCSCKNYGCTLTGKGATLTLPTSPYAVGYAKLELLVRRSVLSTWYFASCYLCLLTNLIAQSLLVLVILSNFILFERIQEAVEHAQATGHVNFQEYRWYTWEMQTHMSCLSGFGWNIIGAMIVALLHHCQLLYHFTQNWLNWIISDWELL